MQHVYKITVYGIPNKYIVCMEEATILKIRYTLYV